MSTHLLDARISAFRTKGAFVCIAQAKWSELASEIHAWVANRTTHFSAVVWRQSRQTTAEELASEPTQGDVNARKLALTCPGLGKLLGLRPVASSANCVEANCVDTHARKQSRLPLRESWHIRYDRGAIGDYVSKLSVPQP